MKQSSLVWILAVMTLLAGCGGQGAAEGDASPQAASGTASEPADDPVDTLKSAIPPKTDYVVVHDPDAVYTEDDLPARGNFLKLDLTGMDPETLNKVIHRFKTEKTPCGGVTCVGMTYEESLVTQAHCDVTLRAAKNVVREEKMKAGEWHGGGN